MLVKREKLTSINNAIEKIKRKTNFTISTKYKILKIQDFLKKEFEIFYTLVQELQKKYNGTFDENGTIKFPEENMKLVNQELFAFNQEEISFPDIYFSLDEFEKEEFSWEEIEAIIMFIK